MRPGATTPRTHGEKFPGPKITAAPAPRPKYPRTRSQAANAKRGRKAAGAIARTQQRPNAGQQRSQEGGEAPGPCRGNQRAPAPKYPRGEIPAGEKHKKNTGAGRAGIPRARFARAAISTHAAPARDQLPGPACPNRAHKEGRQRVQNEHRQHRRRMQQARDPATTP